MIRIEEVKTMKDTLDDQWNISERTVYPGLDGLATWLRRYYYVKK